jgi:hypothetical protein
VRDSIFADNRVASGLLKCENCGSNFVRVNHKDYRCATYTNGGRSACGNGYKLDAKGAEKLLLDHMENDLLSPEAIEIAVKEYADAAKQARRDRPVKRLAESTSIAVQHKDAEIAQLKQLIRAGTIAAATLQPAIETAERERDRLVERGTERSDGDAARVVKQLPDALHAYRGVVRRLSDAQKILTDAEYIEARALICETLGGSIPVKPLADGSASLTLTLDLGPLAEPNKSMGYKLVAGAGFEPATFGL